MTCYHPLKAYKSTERNPATGKYGITFNPHNALVQGSHLSLPCGQCIGCKIDKSKQWAVRLMHERKMHPASSFITLTYSDQHVPQSYSLNKEDWQNFMKRLRDKVGYNCIRFYMCGEYGPTGGRPHYHALIFGHDFPDKLYYRNNDNGDRVYQSPTLNKVWGKSDRPCDIGEVTYQSAAYCARYVVKKARNEPECYYRRSPIDGNFYNVLPEFSLMSLKPGIGTSWFNRYSSDAFPSDFLIIDGKKHPVPRFYLNKLQEDDQTPIKRARKRKALANKSNSTKARLAIREEVQSLRAKRLLRKLES